MDVKGSRSDVQNSTNFVLQGNSILVSVLFQLCLHAKGMHNTIKLSADESKLYKYSETPVPTDFNTVTGWTKNRPKGPYTLHLG